MKYLASFALVFILALAALPAPLAHAGAGAGDGSVQPGGVCETDEDCADVGNVTYWCPDTTCIVDPSVPSTSSTANPPTSSTVNPSTSSTVNPSTSSTVNPSTSSTVNPSTSSSGSTVNLINPLKATSLNDLLSEIITFIIRIGTVVIVLMVVYIGFLFVTAQGEPAKITQAREALMWTVIGALILLGAQGIADAIKATANALGS